MSYIFETSNLITDCFAAFVMHSRREFLRRSVLVLGYGGISQTAAAATGTDSVEPIVDIHQHLSYAGRTNDVLIAHQAAMGVTTTVLMPSGDRGPDHPGGSGEHEAVLALSRAFPMKFVFFANEVPTLADARQSLERQLRKGAIGIGEQKFRVDCDSPEMVMVAEVAREFDVPILLHFSHGLYNRRFERFHRMLERFPTVNFIGHSGAWWANIGKDYVEGIDSPRGPVNAGGLTDRYLRDYPNCFADLSAETGYRAIIRDEAHYREFMRRHQDQLVFGSDCDDGVGRAPLCTGARTIAAIRRLAPSKDIERKILHGNSRRLLKLAPLRVG